jgi:RNA polymerase sigma factor for flagellar operon FliA
VNAGGSPVCKVIAFPAPADPYAKRNALVVAHLGLVPPIARYQKTKLPASFELEDLIAAGNIGLIDAAGKWRAKFRVPFPGYARIRIKGAILSSVRRHEWTNATMLSLSSPGTTEEHHFNNAHSSQLDWVKDIPDTSSGPDEIFRLKEVRGLLESALELLPEREEGVVKTKYLRKEGDLNAAARNLKVCPSRASQLHQKALKELRKSSRLRDLRHAA